MHCLKTIVLISILVGVLLLKLWLRQTHLNRLQIVQSFFQNLYKYNKNITCPSKFLNKKISTQIV